MGERNENRQAVDHMAAEYKKHEALRGNRITAQQAKDRVAEVARLSDAKSEVGANRNKNKRAKPQPQESRRASGKTIIDLGKK